MRILLDADVPKRFKNALPGHEVWTAREAGLHLLNDGPLLDVIAGRFDALVTLDKNLQFQQELAGRSFAVIVLRVRSNRLADVQPLAADVLAILPTAAPGEVVEVGPIGSHG